MSNEDQRALRMTKMMERDDSRKRLASLRQRATDWANECKELAYELDKAADNEPGERTPGLSLQARRFIDQTEYDTIIREIDAERTNLARLNEYLSVFGA